MASVGIRDVKTVFGATPVIHAWIFPSATANSWSWSVHPVRRGGREAIECVTTETEQAGATTGVQD